MGRKRMFGFVDGRCNVLVGCYHDCVYCWARIWAKRLRRICEKCYRFVPHLHAERMYDERGRFRRTPARSIVFVCDMSDMFGIWVSPDVIRRILDFIRCNPQTTFFLETKNPLRMRHFEDEIPRNTIISTTIETDRYPKKGVSKAPSPKERFKAFLLIDHPHKHVSIEPVIDFNLDVLLGWMKEIQPEMVSMGYDNYGVLKKHGIPEPSKEKYFKLKAKLNEFTRVEDKTFGDQDDGKDS